MRRRDLLGGLSLAPLAAPAVAQCVVATFPRINLADRCEDGGATPSLNLSFMVPDQLDPRIAFSRASVGTYFDGAGVMRTATANVARWDYDPATLQLGGLLIEAARTNSLANSGAMATNWVPSAGTFTNASGPAPDGTNAAALFREDATANNHVMQCPLAIVAATQYSISVYAKAAGRSFLRGNGLGMVGAGVAAEWNLSLGTDLSTGSAGGFVHGIQNVGNGWYRCWFTFTSTNTSPLTYNPEVSALGGGAYQGDGASGILFWGAQIELGAFPTSYIPTTSAAVTRNADVASMPVSASWYNGTTGTVFSENILPSNGNNGYRGLFCLDNNVANQWLREFALITSGNLSGSVDAASIGFGAVVPGQVIKSAVAYSPVRTTLAKDGASLAPSVAVLSTSASYSILRIGAADVPVANFLSGYVRQIQYWPRVLSDMEMQQVTR